MSHEVLPPTTSNDELFSQYHDIMDSGVEADGGENISCEGNISHGCVQESINDVHDILGTERDDWTMIGGISTQLLFLHELGEGADEIMRYFGRRTTNDFDILTTSPSQIHSIFRESGYGEDGQRLNADVFGTGFMDEAEDVIDNSRYVDIDGYDMAAEVRVPSPTDLLYTKVHDDYSRTSRGTSSDAEAMLESDMFVVNDERLRSLLGGNDEAWRRLEEMGY